MCDKNNNQDQEKGECSQSQTIINNNMQAYQDQQQQQFLLLQQQQMMQYQQQNTNNTIYYQQPNTQLLPENTPSWSLPPIHSFNPLHEHDPFLIPPTPYNTFFNRPSSSALSDHHHLRILSESVLGPGSSPFGLQAEIMGKMSAQEIMDAKALAASKSHSEAERRRRERINNHLAKLRSLLPSTTKTDKASLLAEVIQHVKELKRQTSIIAETSPIPTETDELTVDASDEIEDGKIIIKASLCCEDRSDLLPDLIKTLKSLRLRTLKAEITTLGGRVKNVLFITGEEDQEEQYCISSIQEALKAVMDKTGSEPNHPESSSSGNAKRQRTANMML